MRGQAGTSRNQRDRPITWTTCSEDTHDDRPAGRRRGSQSPQRPGTWREQRRTRGEYREPGRDRRAVLLEHCDELGGRAGEDVRVIEHGAEGDEGHVRQDGAAARDTAAIRGRRVFGRG